MNNYSNWARYPKTICEGKLLSWPIPKIDLFTKQPTCLPYGNGRSYGDVCLNAGGTLIGTSAWNHFLAFDAKTGLLECESGILFEDILRFMVPQGWFLPVTPGTQFVTLGGAIANDVHGKNHHQAGSIGCHVVSLDLLRSDGKVYTCSLEKNSDLFCATIGGLGLTGMILRARIRMKPIQSNSIFQETIRLRGIDDFLRLTQESDKRFEYTVAWLDCLSQDVKSLRGLFFRGNHSPASGGQDPVRSSSLRFNTFVDWPEFCLSPMSIRAFNHVFYSLNEEGEKVSAYQSFFYPLDRLLDWNRIYGRRGFLQYQCVVPGIQAIGRILEKVLTSHSASFLAVLKVLGNKKSPGLLSFTRPGLTLALDFPFTGAGLLKLLDDCDGIVLDSGGAVNPAKDARMSRQVFEASFPNLRDFKTYKDPQFSSSFWRRVQEEK